MTKAAPDLDVIGLTIKDPGAIDHIEALLSRLTGGKFKLFTVPAVLLLTLVWVVRRNEKQWRGSPGRTASATVIGYTVLRFFTEFLRADNRLVLSALTMPQVLSLLAGATVAAVLCAGRARQTRLLTECPADSKR